MVKLLPPPPPIHVLKFLTPLPQDVILFGNKVIVDIIS